MLDDVKRPIGLLDSGVGGLTVAREIFKLLPEEDIIYFGDTLHLPYGPKDLDLVCDYVEKIIRYLITEKKVKAVVIACNTGTSAALSYMQKLFDIPIFGVINGAVEKAVNLSKNRKIALIGTEGTVNSGAYQKAIFNLAETDQVFARPCPEFVELVEAGKFTGPEVKSTAEFYLEPLREAGVDVLILGCTHFPYLTAVIAEVMGAEVKLVNPAYEVAREVKLNLILNNLVRNSAAVSGQHQFLVSDLSRVSQDFLQHGREFLQLDELNFKEDNIFRN